MDPLSITASLIAIIQLTSKVTSTCWDLRSSFKSAKEDIARIISDTDLLRAVLEALVHLSESDDQGNLQTVRRLAGPDGLLRECQNEVSLLKNSLGRISKSSNKYGLRGLSWHLKEKGVTRHLDRLIAIKSTLQLALSTDQA